VQEGEMDNAIKAMRRLIMNFGPDVVLEANIAKKIAVELKNKFPILVASEHLSGVSYAFKNQLNETSKTFCAMFELPEMNHHLMEGLRNPAHMKGFLRFILFESELYSDRIKKRYTVTADVLDKNEVESLVYRATCETRLEQVFEVLALGSWVQFYLAMLYEIDPAGVPWVDYFKKKLANG